MSDEQGFLKAIRERPDDDTRKLVYADWLEERRDPRGEYLRLMVKVRQDRVVTPEQRRRHHELSAELAELRSQGARSGRADRGSSADNTGRRQRVEELEGQLADLSRQVRQQVPARLQELAAALDPDWLAVVSDPEVERCGRNTAEVWQLRFDFVCDRTWADMRPTGDDTVRHCEACDKGVHFCDNLADAREHSEAGHCIAVDLGVIRREGDLEPPSLFLGRPSKESLRHSYEQDVDAVSQARLKARKQAGKKRPRKP